MALSSLLMHEVCKRLRPGIRVASVGYPDVVAPLAEVEAILGERFSQLRYRDDSDAIRKYHGGEGRIPDAHSFFELQAASLDVFDIAVLRGGEIILDLNYPITDAYTERYDLVIDPGTAEHVMNVGQAMMNLAHATKVGGYAMHSPPMTMVNHGLWSFNPTTFHDWYSQNGWEIEQLYAWKGNEKYEVPAVQRFTCPPEVSLMCVAKRTSADEMKWPVQTKYRKMIEKASA